MLNASEAKNVKAVVIDQEVVSALAAEFAGWRTAGCPGYGFAATFGAKAKKAAAKMKVSYSILCPLIHREAYAIIEADGCARLKSEG